MQLSRQTILSLELLLLCAGKGASESLTLGQAAHLLNTTKDYLSQIMKDLVHHDFVVGQRGRNGGIRLARPAAQIAVTDLLILLEPKLKLAAPLVDKNVCPEELVIVRHVQNAMLGFFGALHGVTLSQLAEETRLLRSDGYLTLKRLVPASLPKGVDEIRSIWDSSGSPAGYAGQTASVVQSAADLRREAKQ